MHLNANNINNYNKFLKKLNETNKKKEKKDLLEKTSCPIEDLLNTIEKEFIENKYHKSIFSGYVDNEKSDKMNSLRLDEYMDFPKTEIVKVNVNIDFKFNSLEDLLLLIEKYPLNHNFFTITHYPHYYNFFTQFESYKYYICISRNKIIGTCCFGKMKNINYYYVCDLKSLIPKKKFNILFF
jgi:hypothetical protein